MSERFTGVCVGGPRDGRWLEHYDKVFCVTIMPRFTAAMLSEPVSEQSMYETFDYVHFRFGRDVGVWVARDQDPVRTIELLIAGYHPAAPENR